ncbi:DUF935 domain-containing protein [Actibacterium sp.]|uniref:DUF935 domain-containing protein n=1 Tax=Actibacterium sp. TaxID=1872125 RepID=UPI0035685357
MTIKPTIYDAFGRPVVRKVLTQEVAAPTIGGVRSPLSGYPMDGLNPMRLAGILRAADSGDVTQYLELAELLEERDLHYTGVLGTRKRSVSQIDITVKPASDSKEDQVIADRVRDWLDRDELSDELFNILDAIGKGYSFTEIIWDSSEGQWEPARLEYRDPRWFTFERHNLTTPLLLNEHGAEVPLHPYKFIYARMQAKSGIAPRSGIARIAAWAQMFKAFTQRDWAIFTQTYGQPIRLGKFQPGATEKDKDTLFSAVANIAGDCAAIIPDTMQMEFIEAKNVGASTDHYERRSDWLDKQVSKAVLGQTATTDSVTGGLGSGKEHREVQEDIERADAKQLQGILNAQLIRPFVDLEFGPRGRRGYPKLIIARPEAEDLGLLAQALGELVPLGLEVSQSETREKFGLSAPKKGDAILRAPAKAGAGDPPPAPDQTALQAEQTGQTAPQRLADQAVTETGPAVADLIAQVELMTERAGSMEELRDMLMTAYPALDTSKLTAAIMLMMVAAEGAGRADVEDESA